MKQIEQGTSSHTTNSTDIAAGLLALGFEPQPENPIIRLFSKRKPPNLRVAAGKGRGGQILYRFEAESGNHNRAAHEIHHALANPDVPPENKEGETFDDLLRDLLDDPKAPSEVKQKLQKLNDLLPLEHAYRISNAMRERLELSRGVNGQGFLCPDGKYRHPSEYIEIERGEMPIMVLPYDENLEETLEKLS
jgi:hypothetical protein